MTPPHLHILGIDPGGTTGWAKLTVPRKSVYGKEPAKILDWDQGQFYGPENEQTDQICELARRIQSLDYLIGPAMVAEDFQLMTQVRGEALLSPVRMVAKLSYALYLGRAGDSRLVLQHRQIAKTTATDDRLKAWRLYKPGEEHARDAMRHAITALRRAKADPALRALMWADP